MKTRGLGKGLGALIPGAVGPQELGVIEIPVNQIAPSPFQPRVHMAAEQFADLVASVRSHGVLQPIVARPDDGGYQVVAGERRWRAAVEAGLETIPAVVRTLTDREALEIALVENLQREDLNPIERARAYQRLIQEFGLSQEDVASHVGKSRPAVANVLRLLSLPPEVQASIESGRITEGHGRALLGIEEIGKLLTAWSTVERRSLSVRVTEALVRRLSRKRGRARRSDPHVGELERILGERLATKVRIRPRGGRGIIQIEYYSQDDLQRLLDIIASS